MRRFFIRDTCNGLSLIHIYAAQSAEALQAQQAAYLQNLEQEQAEIDAALAQKERALEAAKQAVMDAMNRASDVKARKSQLETMLANVENRLQELAGAMQRAQAQVDAAIGQSQSEGYNINGLV